MIQCYDSTALNRVKKSHEPKDRKIARENAEDPPTPRPENEISGGEHNAGEIFEKEPDGNDIFVDFSFFNSHMRGNVRSSSAHSS